ncbi:MAG: hypothetical protein P8J32_05495 [bacterium]|nr:hypothetical protein [bacterium]
MKQSNIILTSVLINLLVTIVIVGAGANYLLNQIKQEAMQAVSDLIETTAATSDNVYDAVLDFKKAVGNHTKVFSIGVPEESLESEEAFTEYIKGREDTLADRVEALHKTLDSPFFKTFDSSYLEDMKQKLELIQKSLSSD